MSGKDKTRKQFAKGMFGRVLPVPGVLLGGRTEILPKCRGTGVEFVATDVGKFR